MARAISLKAISIEAGVSVSTVSRALQHHPRIPQATCQRIEEIALRMGYRPDARLAQLMAYLRKDKPTRSHCNLAWLNTYIKASELQLPWNIGYYQGAQERAVQMGFSLDIINADDFRAHPPRLNSVLKNRGIEGLILPQFWNTHPIADHIDWNSYCTVFLDEFSPNLLGSRVSTYYHWNIRIAMEKLRDLGYQRPGAWLSDFIDYNTGRAYSTFIPWALARWFPQPHLPIYSIESELGLSTYLKKFRPDVLIVNTNTALNRLNQFGLRVPEDIAVIHLNLASDVPNWTGIDQGHREVGYASVDSLVAQLQRHELGISRISKQIFIPGQWQDGFTAIAR